VKVDNVSVGAVASYTSTDVTAAHSIEASFVHTTHTITASALANGAIAPSGAVVVADGVNQSFTITADPHYQILDVKVDNVSVGAVASYPFTDVTSDHSIEASFVQTTYTITATALANGAISPSGAVSRSEERRQGLTSTADPHYEGLDDKVDN